MKDIISQAKHDAWKINQEIRFVDLTSENGKALKAIARQQARERYPRGTKQERGLFVHQFIRKIRQYEMQALYEEWNADFTGGI